jgi:hypothetical protein
MQAQPNGGQLLAEERELYVAESAEQHTPGAARQVSVQAKAIFQNYRPNSVFSNADTNFNRHRELRIDMTNKPTFTANSKEAAGRGCPPATSSPPFLPARYRKWR